MKRNTLFKSVLMAAMVGNAIMSYAQTDKSNEKGWTNLFDGKTLNG